MADKLKQEIKELRKDIAIIKQNTKPEGEKQMQMLKNLWDESNLVGKTTLILVGSVIGLILVNVSISLGTFIGEWIENSSLFENLLIFLKFI